MLAVAEQKLPSSPNPSFLPDLKPSTLQVNPSPLSDGASGEALAMLSSDLSLDQFGPK